VETIVARIMALAQLATGVKTVTTVDLVFIFRLLPLLHCLHHSLHFHLQEDQ